MFLRQQQSDGLEWLRNNIMTEAAITTQKVVRVKLSRNELLRRRKEKYAIKIQSCARRFIATRDVQILVLQIHYATVIQAHHRGSVQRVQYKVLLYEKRKDAEERKRSKVEFFCCSPPRVLQFAVVFLVYYLAVLTDGATSATFAILSDYVPFRFFI